jgi:tetratricopeptide (TPR) repeat protein
MKILPSGTGKVEELPDVAAVAGAGLSPIGGSAPRQASPRASPRAKQRHQSGQSVSSGRKRAPAKQARPGQQQTAASVADQHGVCMDDLEEFAQFLDVDMKEVHLLSTVCQSINADLPDGWQECDDPKSGESYYWNRTTDTTSWEHPLDAGFRKKIAQLRKRGPAAPSGGHEPSVGSGDADMYKRGRDLLGAKEYTKAAAVFTAAIAVEHPEQALCFNLRGVCHSWLGKHDDALDDADAAVKLRPSATMFCNRGKAYRALKRYAEAKADLLRALQLQSDHKHAVTELKSLEETIRTEGYTAVRLPA